MKKNKRIFVFIAVIVGIAIVFYLKLYSSPIMFTTSEYYAGLYTDGVHLTSYLGKEENVIIPNYIGIFPVTAISIDCFNFNDSIRTVTIPDNVKSIGNSAFCMCNHLKSVKANNIRVVERDAFNGDWNLEVVELGDKLLVIGDDAFHGCMALTYIPSKESLEEIGNHAFEQCEIVDSGDLTGINVGDGAFDDCPWSKAR